MPSAGASTRTTVPRPGALVMRQLRRRSRPRGCASTRDRSDRDGPRPARSRGRRRGSRRPRVPVGPRRGPTPCSRRACLTTLASASRPMPKSWASARGAEREAALGRLHVDRQARRRSDEPRRLSDEGRHEPVLERVTAQLGDEVAHLGLRAERQLADRLQVPREPAVGARALLRERLLGGAGVQQRREQRLRDGVVQVARDPVALLHRLLALAALGLGQLPRRTARAR